MIFKKKNETINRIYLIDLSKQYVLSDSQPKKVKTINLYIIGII